MPIPVATIDVTKSISADVIRGAIAMIESRYESSWRDGAVIQSTAEDITRWENQFSCVRITKSAAPENSEIPTRHAVTMAGIPMVECPDLTSGYLLVVCDKATRRSPAKGKGRKSELLSWITEWQRLADDEMRELATPVTADDPDEVVGIVQDGVIVKCAVQFRNGMRISIGGMKRTIRAVAINLNTLFLEGDATEDVQIGMPIGPAE